MNQDRVLSPAGANLIRSFEGCRELIAPDSYRAWKCPAGVPTIGWGHTNDYGRQFEEGDIWNSALCERVFMYDTSHATDLIRRWVKPRLTQFQFDALVSFAFNAKDENLEGSTLLERLNARDLEGAVDELLRWTRAGGKAQPALASRRAREALLFQGIRDVDYANVPDLRRLHRPIDPMPQALDAPEAKDDPIRSYLQQGTDPTIAPSPVPEVEKGAEV